MIQYKDNRGFSDILPADLHKELKRIKKGNGGVLTPEAVVAASRLKIAILHKCFEWNDSEAAAKYRIHTARNVINCVVIVDSSKNRCQAFISCSIAKVNKDDSITRTRQYLTSSQVLSNPRLRDIHLESIKNRLLAIANECSHFEEFEKVWTAIRDLSLVGTP